MIGEYRQPSFKVREVVRKGDVEIRQRFVEHVDESASDRGWCKRFREIAVSFAVIVRISETGWRGAASTHSTRTCRGGRRSRTRHK